MSVPAEADALTRAMTDQFPPFGPHRNHREASPRVPPDGIAGPIAVLAWLHIGLGLMGLIVGCLFCLELWLIPGWLADFALAFALPIFICLTTVLFLPAMVGGIGLLRGKAWARIIIFLLSLALIFLFPLGTILGGFGLVALRTDPAPTDSL